jgi:hypothetical protein
LIDFVALPLFATFALVLESTFGTGPVASAGALGFDSQPATPPTSMATANKPTPAKRLSLVIKCLPSFAILDAFGYS